MSRSRRVWKCRYTLEQTAARLKKKTHRHVSPSTITTWLNEYRRRWSGGWIPVGLQDVPWAAVGGSGEGSVG